MRTPPPLIINVLDELDDRAAAERLDMMRAITHALEQRYAHAIERQAERNATVGQSELWPDNEPPF